MASSAWSKTAVNWPFAEHYLTLAERAEKELHGPTQAEWLRRLEVEHDNLTAALKLAADGPDPEALVRFAVALWRFWELHGHLTEGRAYTECALAAAAPVAPQLRAAVLLRSGVLAWRQGDLKQAQDRLEEGLALGKVLRRYRGVELNQGRLGLQTVAT